jgi:hypothetical protein
MKVVLSVGHQMTGGTRQYGFVLQAIILPKPKP